MDDEIANSEVANSGANEVKETPANRKEYMRELMRKKRAEAKVLRDREEARNGGLDARDVGTEVVIPSEAVVVNLTRTDRKFERDRPGYYIFGGEMNERECWKCGESFKTRMELNKFCGPKCKDEWLSDAFGKLKRGGN